MDIVSARELKNKTGEILRRVRSGKKILVTRRGKPCAVIEWPENVEKEESFSLRPFDIAWEDLLNTLARTEPEFKNWEEATKWARGRV